MGRARTGVNVGIVCALLAGASSGACSGDGGSGAHPADPPHTRMIRAFAVSNHLLFRDGESPEAFETKMRALMDSRYRTGDLVQTGVPDVASHLIGPDDPADPVGTARDLVVFTEDVGLILAVQGERAAKVRNPSLSAMNALIQVALMRLPQVILNLQKFDVSLNRAAFLALTDTFWRAFNDTFSRIARDYRVYVASCENVADARLSTNPLDLRLYGDPEHPERTDVWLPETGEVHNQTVIYAPDGSIVNRTRKVYLTPPEEDPAFFNLSFGAIEDLKALDTPVGRLGVAISKDAWMADVVDRLDQMGVEVVIQPDADIGNWAAVTAGNEVWFPDNWEAGNYMHVQKYPSLRHNVTPMMTGNLYEFNFDGQASIMSDTVEGEKPRGFVGQIPKPGFVEVGQWAMADPGTSDPGLSLEARRSILMDRSNAMDPHSGSPFENAYGESVIFADLAIPVADRLPRPSNEPILGPNVKVDGEKPTGPRWDPSIALGPRGSVFVAWTDLGDRNEDILFARSDDGGTSFASPARVDDSGDPRPDQQENQWDARLAARPDGSLLVAAWTDFRSDNWEIYLARSEDGGGTWSRPAVRVDGAGDAATTGENLLYDPRPFFGSSGDLYVVWTDNRAVSDTDIVLRKSADGGLSFDPEVRVDDTGDGPINDEAGPTGLGHTYQFNPDGVAAGGKVYVAWQDTRNGRNDVYFALSDDGGKLFGRNLRVDASDKPFRHQYFPSIAIDLAGRVYVVWQDSRRDLGDIYLARSDDGGASFSAPVRVDDSGDSYTTQSYPRVGIDPAGGHLYVAWRDERFGDPDVRTALSRDRGATFEQSRPANDRSSAVAAQFPPELAVDPDGNALVVWHDNRSGTDDVYLARGRLD